jgi:hypothetical protein
MKLYRFHQRFTEYEIGYKRSTVLEVLRSLHPRSPSGAWTLPAKIAGKEISGVLWLSKMRRWPDVIDPICVSFFQVISARCAELFAAHTPNDVELVPISVQAPPRYRPVPTYFILNVFRTVDCLNISDEPLTFWNRPPDPEIFTGVPGSSDEGVEALDPDRIPDGVNCFYARHQTHMYVTGPLAKALLATRPKYADLIPVRLKRETPAQRTAALARIRREYDEAMKKKPPPAPKVAISSLAVPEVVAAFFASDARRDFRNVEVFDADACSSAMGSLLAWKDLRWPKGHIPIADDGRGGYFALDTSRTKAGDCPVVYFDHELADVDKKSGAITPNFEPCDDTFAAWLKRVKNGSTGLPRRKR